jgi:hypothetical protein
MAGDRLYSRRGGGFVSTCPWHQASPMDATRRFALDLVREGLVERVPNADHRRSQLVRLTQAGRATYAVMDARQAAWVNRIADGIGRAEPQTTARVLDELCRRLEADSRAEKAAGEGEEK